MICLETQINSIHLDRRQTHLQSFRNLLLVLRNIVHLDTETMTSLEVCLFLIITRWRCSLYSRL
nr:MAG TPA: hypothetical protein [Crassvirales sp.]